MSGIKDVAALAGVSISTVSNVLNGTKYVSPELSERVMKAVEELSYHADPIARSMKSNRTGIIGVIVEDIGGVFYPYVVKGIDKITREKNYQMIICDVGNVSSNVKAIEKEESFFRSLTNSRVDGILFVSCIQKREESSYLTKIKKIVNKYKQTPLVSLERDFSQYGIDSVFFDSYENARIAVDHLIDVGCRKIGMVTGPKALQIAQQRTAGFIDVLTEKGMILDKSKQIVNGDYTHQSGYRGVKKLCDLNPDLDGVFLANDQMAVGAIKYLKRENVKIPEQIKVIGYDDIFFSGMIEPSLSTIHVAKNRTGIEAAKILFDLIENGEGSVAKGIKMESNLVVRNSTVKNSPDDWILTEW